MRSLVNLAGFIASNALRGSRGSKTSAVLVIWRND
jgi:hypothetical protein